VTGNTAASVRARLTNRAKSTQRPFQEVLQHYGLERLLYRLAQSPHRSRFLLKGALLLNAWNAPSSRPTRDIDLLGYVENDVAAMEALFREVCDTTVADDGLRFDATTLVGRRIKEDADYQGVRLTFAAFLEKARIPLQIDVGFGDVVHPGAEERDYPTLLELPAPHLPCVLIAGVEAGTMPLELSSSADETARQDHLDTEKRLLFVAATRARGELVVTGFGAKSEFLKD